jgi:hypothetical protein
MALSKKALREGILRSLKKQGFRVRSDGTLALPKDPDKDKLRELHRHAVAHRVAAAKDGLRTSEDRLLAQIASGSEIDPAKISPIVRRVRAGSEDELLFRYARLHWSIPVSAGYGRRLRFVVIDASNGKLIGVIGLCDPIYNLSPRDQWIGWTADQKRRRLQCVMEAFALGAVPPYSHLLCGKLVALLASTNEVRAAFYRRYHAQRSLIGRKASDGRLALVTTNSALGRSSIYNRLAFSGVVAFQSVGYTLGSGEFHFSNGMYHDIRTYGLKHCAPTAKHSRWGEGFRNKRELVRKVLSHIGLSHDLNYHGIQREVFVVPTAANSREFLRGEHERLLWHDRTAAAVADSFRERWLLPRASWDLTYKTFEKETYRLWPTPKGARHV